MKKHFTRTTTLLALLLSASVGVGLFSLLGCLSCCFDAHPRRYPYFFPFCMITGYAALAVFCLGFWKYIERRCTVPSFPGVIADVLGSILLVPGFFWLFGIAVEFAREWIP